MITLRQLIAPITQHNASLISNTTLQLTKALAAHSQIIDIQFQQFELDSRKLDDNDVFVLLKSQTQPIENRQDYVKTASKKAAFIISEIPLTKLGLDSHELGCIIIEFPAIRSILGSLIQQSFIEHAKQGGTNSSSTSQTLNSQTVNSQTNKVQKDSAHLIDVQNYPHSDPVENIHTEPVKRDIFKPDTFTPLPKVVAVTGTNGKTTITQLVAQLCHSDKRTTAVMGTAGNGRLSHLQQASHTTGDALAVQTFLRQMADEHVDILALEASSHGLDQLRLQGVPIQVAIYTNLSRDHLDYHPDMQDYAAAKAKLFDRAHFPSLTHAIINLDDEFAPLMLQTAAESGLQVWTYSIHAKKSATFKATQISPSLEGVEMELVSDFGTVWLNSPLLGRFNVANLLAAIAATMSMGVALSDIPNLVRQLKGADGRMQRVRPYSEHKGKESEHKGKEQNASQSQGCFIVDYAHTPDALTQVLTSLQPHCEGSLWAVFGCGGDRDSGKRPLMAQAGLAGADKVILTSDNPRSEDPKRILEDMTHGISATQLDKTLIIADRKKAIEYAVTHASPQDIVVIAGKGHETYQEINGVRHDFDDRVVLQEAMSQ